MRVSCACWPDGACECLLLESAGARTLKEQHWKIGRSQHRLTTVRFNDASGRKRECSGIAVV
eukprot:6209581-Pleurochrysis_carterae.AAC.2